MSTPSLCAPIPFSAGPATILNNSSSVIHAGDTIAWTFYSESGTSTQPRAAHGAVRRIGIRVADL